MSEHARRRRPTHKISRTNGEPNAHRVLVKLNLLEAAKSKLNETKRKKKLRFEFRGGAKRAAPPRHDSRYDRDRVRGRIAESRRSRPETDAASASPSYQTQHKRWYSCVRIPCTRACARPCTGVRRIRACTVRMCMCTNTYVRYVRTADGLRCTIAVFPGWPLRPENWKVGEFAFFFFFFWKCLIV